MLKFALSFGLAVVLVGTSVIATPPQRVVSTNLCADQLVLGLLPRARIAAVSPLAADPALSAAHRQAEGIPVVRQSAEDVIRQHPDLVVAGSFREQKAAEIVARQGIAVHRLPSPDGLTETAVMIRALAARLEVPEAGEAMVARLTADLADARTKGPINAQTALIWRPNGYTSGQKSVSGEILEAVGYSNLAGSLGVVRGGAVSVEAVLAAKPNVLVIDDHMNTATSRAQAIVTHPALAASTAERVRVPTAAWICAGPSLAAAATALVRDRP
jgi:iron complex transport system substrate-binding protein